MKIEIVDDSEEKKKRMDNLIKKGILLNGGIVLVPAGVAMIAKGNYYGLILVAVGIGLISLREYLKKDYY